MKQKFNIGKILNEHKRVFLDIGCGGNKVPGYVGIDIQSEPGVDIVHDLESFPWPIPDNSIDFARLSHVLEHINPAKFGVINFMNEIWRVLKPGAQLAIIVPYAGSEGYWADPTHINPCTEVTWAYFDPLDRSNFYRIYKPKPWKIVPDTLSWNVHGFMEVALEKRIIDKSYGQ